MKSIKKSPQLARTEAGLVVPSHFARQLPEAPAPVPPEERAWPEGPQPPPGGWNPYRVGLDLLGELGLLRAVGPYLLLKAIMPGDDSFLEVVHEHVRGAVAFEIVGVGGEVPEAKGLRPGLHVLHISSSSDAVEPRRGARARSRYVFCHHEDVPTAWDPAELVKLLHESDGLTFEELRFRAEAAGLVAPA